MKVWKRGTMFRGLATILACLACCSSVRAQQSTLSTMPSRTADQVVAKQVAPDKTPLLLQADDLVYDNRNNRIIARGNVEIYYNENVLLANEVIYDKSVNTLTAIGNVRMKDSDGSVVNAERLTLSSDFRDGFIRSLHALTQDDTRVAASNAYKKGDKTIFENGVITACKPCEAHPERPPIWRIKSERVTDDKTDQNVYYENSIMEVFGVPVAWIPWFYTPDPSVQQRSGFMAPYYGSNTSLGYLLAIPYYWAISPNYDLTLTPELTTKAGYLMQADWRQRLWNAFYEVHLDGVYNNNAPDGETNFRGSVVTTGNVALNGIWSIGWNATLESDQTFRVFYDLDNVYAYERVSSIFLTGMADRNYFNMTVAQYGNLTGANVFDYETNSYVQTVTATAYPVIDYNYIHNKPVFGGELSFDINALALTVNNPANTLPTGYAGNMEHIVSQAEWRRTFTDDIGERFTPFVLGRADLYSVPSEQEIDGVSSGPMDTFTREMIGVGLDYRYPFVANTATASHVIEPVVQVIARGGGSNANVPNEDAQSLVFDDTLLFDINKFSGYDRIENDTRTNFGLQYTYQNFNGVSVRAIGGESVHLAGPNPYSYNPTSGLATDPSDYVAGGYVDYMNRVRLLAQIRINEQNAALSYQNYSLQTKLGFFQGALSYVSVQAQPELGFPNTRDEIATFAALKLNDEWTIFGDLRYDIELGQWVRDSAGIQYADECFIFSVTYQQTYTAYMDVVPSTAVMVRVGLKGFGQQTTPSSIVDLSPEAAVFR